MRSRKWASCCTIVDPMAAMYGSIGMWVSRTAGFQLSISVRRQISPCATKTAASGLLLTAKFIIFKNFVQVLRRKVTYFVPGATQKLLSMPMSSMGASALAIYVVCLRLRSGISDRKLYILPRDRVGKKPLYYYSDALVFLFASEIKALFADRRVPREPELAAIDYFLALGYVPGPQTAFRKIWKLAPAHWLEVRSGKIETGRYWTLRYSPKRRISFADAKEELQWRFDEAVRIRLVSDVPLGAFLSGGVDSTAVVISMAKAMDRPVRTFSVGFGQSNFDERQYAREVARRYCTDHTELVVDAPVTDILSRLAWHYDEPFGDSSAVPSYLISQLTRNM